MDSYTLVLQAGGMSTRMGTDKGLVPFLDTTLAGYILAQTAGLSDDVIVISNDPEAYYSLGLPVFPDIIPGWGALGGLHAAVSRARREWCLVLACDMPFLNIELINYMAGQADAWDAVVPRLQDTGFTEPFRAFYRKTCLAPIERAILSGRRRANSFFEQVRMRYVEQAEIDRFDPRLLSFFNVNTPEDLQKAVEIAAPNQS